MTMNKSGMGSYSRRDVASLQATKDGEKGPYEEKALHDSKTW